MRLNILIALAALIVCLALAGGVVFINSKDSLTQKVSEPKEQIAAKEQKSSDPNSSLGVSTSELGQLDGGILLNNNGDTSQSKTEILTPDQFYKYDEYVNGDKMLYFDIQKGTGGEAILGKRVAVTYKGWLTNGTLFDQSRINEENKIEPFIFTLGGNQVISGWETGLKGMKVGGTRRLVIPPLGAYGAEGKDQIPPNSVLIFDINLIEVEK